MKGLCAFATLAVLFSGAAAHTIFQELHVNGVSAGHTVGIRVPSYNGPVENVNSNDIICNGGINPYRQPVSQAVIPVPAGATLTAEWHHMLDNHGGNSDPIDSSHKGPVMAYLAKVPSATQTTVTGLKWFKIYQDGYDPATKTWAVDKLIANKGLVSFKVPDCIESGEYLLRVELIALHAAGNYPGAQFYMECAQIKITGGGNVTPANTVSFPGAYSGSDPGVKISIYQNLSSYTIPGPSVFTCPSGGNPNPQPTQAPTPSPVPSTTTPPVVVPSQPPSGTVPQWGQCGGIGYSGPTECVAPYKCSKTNDWYSQCV